MIKSKYLSKAKDSFNTKLNIFLYHYNNKLSISILEKEFSSFEIKQPIIDKYTADWQIRYSDEEGDRVKDIDNRIDIFLKDTKNEEAIAELQEKYINNRFKKIFPIEKFEELINPDIKKCHYCKITEENIKLLIEKKKIYKKHITRGWTFEIDRLKPNEEYYEKNCVLSCYWCNNAKTDEFDGDEFKIIGKAIKKVWKKRLKQ